MPITTTSFHNLKALKDKKFICIAICNSLPAAATGQVIHIPSVAPDWETIKKYRYAQIDQKQFKQEYVKKLEKIDATKPEFFMSLKNDEDKLLIALLCHEPKGKFCHRKILAEWLNEQYHMNITEL